MAPRSQDTPPLGPQPVLQTGSDPRSPQPSTHPPSVDALARSIADVGIPQPLLVDAARDAIADGNAESARKRAEYRAATLLQRVINATGVLLHTNLGRAPVDVGRAGDAVGPAPFRYSNVEIDLGTGKRSSRNDHAASLLARACGAEAAHVVNNGAAAVLLVLATLARDKGVVVSRGELVEIGGGFRVPEVLAQSGARLVEVGTTNRTRSADYRAAIEADEGVGLILKVHQSNYRIVGFTESVGVDTLAALGPPVVADIGSGLLDAAAPWLDGGPPTWLAGEPAVRQTLAAGAALVTFSGDKLLGGPQAGVIAGRADLVAACARHPLSRALRPGGSVLAELQGTALAYLWQDAASIPFWRMASTPVEILQRRAEAMASSAARPCATIAVAGGGSLPGQELPSAGLAVAGDHSAALRAHRPPIVARVRDGETVCDLRTVDPADDQILATALADLPGDPEPNGS